MKKQLEELGFLPADMLLPKDADMTRWSVVACDQFTSQPEYWERVEQFVGDAPSTLYLILPESRLGTPRETESVREINQTMKQYLQEGVFQTLEQSLIYVERQQANGKIRCGIVGVVDLEHYDYRPGATSLIRATEGTVLSRIPPRVAVRKDAPLETSHIMLLIDDPMKTAIEAIGAQTGEMELLYQFELMENGGSISGWRVTKAQEEQLAAALAALADPTATAQKYQMEKVPPLLFAVGDGNHSLATAKENYERKKRVTPKKQWETLPARFAMAEVVNLHDDSLEFEPIHRVVFDVSPEDLVNKLLQWYKGAFQGEGEGHQIRYVYGETEGVITVPSPKAKLEVGTLQNFLDGYIKTYGGKVDYIHGADVTRELARQAGNIGFILPAMAKSQLFPTVMTEGVLPRKTFSMGEAWDKRYYLECRKIR
ncbi:MAG: DUF1015 domain-containing protein [Oscillospiraceae bacterium]|nr:DUF1015 domain-containing protein [Oscillospiraceae bacterium]